MGQAFHGKFHILSEAVAAPAVFLHNICRNAHACAAEAGGQAQIILAQMPQMVDGPEGNGKGAGYPGVCGVLGRQIALQHLLALQKAVVHNRQEIQMDQVIGVEDAESIISFVQGENLREYPIHGIALPTSSRLVRSKTWAPWARAISAVWSVQLSAITYTS